MVPVSGEIKEESSKFEPVNFIYDKEVKDGTDDTFLAIRYKYVIEKSNMSTRSYIITSSPGKHFCYPREKTEKLFMQNSKPGLTSLIKNRRCS